MTAWIIGIQIGMDLREIANNLIYHSIKLFRIFNTFFDKLRKASRISLTPHVCLSPKIS